MLKIEKTEVSGWRPAIRGMRNPMNSWDKSDTLFNYEVEPVSYDLSGECYQMDGEPWEFEGRGHEYLILGTNDEQLMTKLVNAGSVDAKFRRMINVTCDITAPLYWWKEFDTYKVGTVANSCSTMHKIHDKEFMLDDFSHEHLIDWQTVTDYENECDISEEESIAMTPGIQHIEGESMPDYSLDVLNYTIKMLNKCRELYLKTKKKTYWWQMIQLLPSSYNQKRTVQLNYEVLAGIYPKRKDHKLDEWHTFCDWIEKLPYAPEIITGKWEDLFRNFKEKEC